MTDFARVIPRLDLADGRVVTGGFSVDRKDAGDPVALARAYDSAGADELCLLDIVATHAARGTMLNLVRRTSQACSIPLTVGGGVSSVADADAFLQAGANKIAVNAATITRPEIVSDLADRFGSPRIVAAIDARAVDNGWVVVLHGRNSTQIDAVAHAVRLSDLGAGELLVTSLDRDGTGTGFDLALTRAIADEVRVPVIASGGAGTIEDLVAGVSQGHADAVHAASLFHHGSATIAQAHAALAEAAALSSRPRVRGAFANARRTGPIPPRLVEFHPGDEALLSGSPEMSNLMWLIHLHLTAARRWLAQNPPRVEEAEVSLRQLEALARSALGSEATKLPD